MTIIIALLIFVVGYVVSKFLLSKVASLAEIAEVLAIAIGVVLALIYAGFLH